MKKRVYISPEQVLEIKALWAQELERRKNALSLKALGARYGVSYFVIWQIVNGLGYKNGRPGKPGPKGPRKHGKDEGPQIPRLKQFTSGFRSRN